ncbi:MAG: hypothetical protein Q8R92_04210 [Deltaproteobacteria bacterium]|nr:hypothetical protein [Deltaproteobacteria bacterium]
MKAYLLRVLVIDHNEVGAGIRLVIEATRYPNRCIAPTVLDVTEHQIGEWSDDHPLNYAATDALAWIKEYAPGSEDSPDRGEEVER